MATEEHTEEEVLPLAATISLDDDEKSESFHKNADLETATATTELPTEEEEEVKPINPQTSIEKDIIINIDSASNEIETENKNQNEKNSIDKLDPNDLSAFTLIDRAHSDPLALQSNTSQMMNTGENNPDLTLNKQRNSILASQKKHHSHDDILNKAELLDFGGFNIREFSVEVIGTKYDMKEEIVVPARDNLVKIPFYSTPLTLEATNNAFYDFRERLNDMGFIEQAEAALIHTQCESIENAVAFILHNMGAIYHRFGNSNESALGAINEENKTCTLCNASFDQHLIDYNGNKIEIGMNEDNYNHDADIINFGEDSLLAEEFQDESVKIEIRGIALDAERINEIIQKTESQFAAAIVYDGATEQCLICFEEKPVDFYMKSECGHDKYCKQCLTQHYKIKTKDGDVLKVKCIDPSCEREIREEEILNFLTDDKDIKEKFLKFKRQKLLMLNENARFCPSADCEGYMIGSRLKPKLICPECSTIICFNCSKLWHGYFTKCSSAQNAIQSGQNESDKKYYQWELNKDVKKCPKCKMRIEKTEGCNHMTCVSCKYEFCWVCKGKYNSNHFSQWNVFGCPGAQYNNRASICSIQRCPACMPMWLRRLLIIFAFILLLPIIIVFGILAGCVYGCAICVVFIFENVCSCC